jgi:hypothetical protein
MRIVIAQARWKVNRKQQEINDYVRITCSTPTIMLQLIKRTKPIQALHEDSVITKNLRES